MPIKENMLSTRQWMIACGVLTVALVFLANHQLQRIAAGQLFLFAMPWDAAPAHVELVDAKLSVAETQTAAVLTVAAIGLAAMMTGPAVLKTVRQQTLISRILLIGFTIAVLADMLSTVWFSMPKELTSNSTRGFACLVTPTDERLGQSPENSSKLWACCMCPLF